MSKLKLVLDEEVRRVKFPPDGKTSWQFQDLILTTRESFPSIVSDNFKLQYIDEDEERVTIANDSELREALLDHQEMNKKTVRLFVVRSIDSAAKVSDGGGKASFEAPPQMPSRCSTVNDLLSFVEHILPVKLKNGAQLRGVLSQLFNDVAVKAAVQAALDTSVAQEAIGAVTTAFLTGKDPIEAIASRRQSLFPLMQNLLLTAPQLLQVVPHLISLHAEWSSFAAAEDEDEDEDEEDVSPAVHARIICDGCGCNPIVGVRYKCAVRDDFDLCESCEASGNYDMGHPMLKINTPAQAPAAIMVVLKEGQQTEAEAETEAAKAAAKQAEFLKKAHDGSLTLAEAERAGPRFMKRWLKHQRKGWKGRCHNPHWRNVNPDLYWRHHGPRHGRHGHRRHGRGHHRGHGSRHGRHDYDHCVSHPQENSSATSAASPEKQEQSLLTPAALVSSLANTFLGCSAMQQANTPTPTATPSNNNDVSQEEQQLLDAAIRDSLESLCCNKEETVEKKDDSAKKAKLPVAASCAFPHKAKFVADETEAAGVTGRLSTMKPAQSFTQRWRMVNSGDTAWSPGCRIKHVGADKLGHETGEKEISLEPIEPGTEIVIELPLVAPAVEGEYWSYWRMQTADGTRFGDRVWVHCFVNNSAESDSPANWVDIGEDNVESIALESIAGVQASEEVSKDSDITASVSGTIASAPADCSFELPVASEPSTAVEYQYAAQLKILAGMGFVEGVKPVLEQHDGDIGKTVNQLLQ
jgi:hypothetical protein